MFECASGVSEHCAGADLFDPAYRDEDGAAICIACAIALGLHDPKTDAPATDDVSD